VGYGTLRFVEADAIETAGLGPHDILVTNQVPFSIPLLAGLITESFQTPLAHVNVLSRGRGTPNMGLKNAREDARLKPLLGKLVRLEVRGSDFVVAEADPSEALAFWEKHKPTQTVSVPRLDTSVRGLVSLADSSIADIPTIGSKAAQLAELGKVTLCSPASQNDSRIPTNAFAIPFTYSIEHFSKSGAASRLTSWRADPRFNADPTVRQQGLAEVQADILKAEVDPELLRLVRERIASQWAGQSVRLRSSSNTEDLPQFNGAGLYTSEAVDAASSSKDVADGIRTVWASLWRLRAYDERAYYNIDQGSVAMAVLIHEAFSSEKANGVAISRDILEPARGDKYTINAQVGEALVTNPAPGVLSDEFTYSLGRSPHIERQSVSSLNNGTPVLTDDESYRVACSLAQIHDHFRPLLDPEAKNSWFAMDVEFKFIGPNHQLVVKQARPYSFGQEAPIGWCDL
jgi:phosphoenolpyruvate synthase/pyruvate phosphate dikinase